MIQIEELAKVVLQIIMNRNTNAARHTPELIQTVYNSLKLDRPALMTVPPEELIRRLDSDDNGGILPPRDSRQNPDRGKLPLSRRRAGDAAKGQDALRIYPNARQYVLFGTSEHAG